MNFDPKKTIFLIDGSSYLYRAYYALKPLHTLSGVPVQGVYSFCRMIKKLINQFNPEYMALVWDAPGKTTRHQMYQDYKSTRQEPPSDLFEQKKFIVTFADLIGLKQLEVPGIEADDLMYSLAKERTKESDSVVFITSDKDMAQALSDKVIMYDTFKDILLDAKKFEELKGYPVSKVPFYFSMLGDASDNIPGVRGVGKKGAFEVVQQFDSLEELYANLDAIKKPRMKKAFEENKENAFLSRDLFLLQYHPTNLHKEDLAFDAHNWKQARPLFKELNFKTLLTQIDKETGQDVAPDVPAEKKMIKYDFKTIVKKEALENVVKILKEKKVCAIDTETTGIDPLKNEVVGISLAWDATTACYIPFGHKTGEVQLSQQEVIAMLKPVLEDPTIKKYLHHTKFDQKVLWHAGITLQGVAFDSLIAAKIVHKEWEKVGLKRLSERYFKEPMLTYKDVVKDNKFQNFCAVPLQLATRYAAADALQTFKLVPLLQEKLKAENLESLYYEVELPLSQLLFTMETTGIRLDTNQLVTLNRKVTEELSVMKEQIAVLAGKAHAGINLNSPQQVEQLLFYDLQLTPVKKSRKTKRFSTDASVLRVLAKEHPIAGLILRYRELAKLKSTYIEALPNYVLPKTNKIHTSYSQTMVATGRLSSASPNLQNIPTDDGYGVAIRDAFKPEDGHVFISADYSQIELRVLAQLSQDKNLQEAFLRNKDIHSQTAAGLFKTPLEQVTQQQRQIGKRINFSILYGLTAYGLAKDLEISQTQAKEYITTYFAQYPQVREWMLQVVEETKDHGYVSTMLGRRRYIPAIYEGNQNLYNEACRVAINTRAQGTAADIMKMGMINLKKAFAEHNINAHILLQIHDELLLSVPEEQKERAQEITKQVLESVVDWSVPLQVTTRIGASWKEVTK